MALSFTSVLKEKLRDTSKKFRTVYKVTFDNAYPTGGWPVLPGDVGFLTTLYAFYVTDIDGYYHLMVDHPNKKILAGYPVGSQPLFIGANVSGTPASNSATVNVPSGTIDGDILVAQVAYTGTLTEPSGFTLVDSMGMGSGTMRVEYRVASAEPASYTWTVTGMSVLVRASLRVYRGIDTANVVDGHAGASTTATASHQAPSVSPVAATTIEVTTYGINISSSWTPPGGETERYDSLETFASIEGNDEFRTSAGATGTKTATSSAVGNGAAHNMCLKALSGVELANNSPLLDGKTAIVVAWGS